MTTTSDEHAFGELFERHRAAVHAFLLARTSDPEAARDLLQEVFLRVWRRLDEVRRLDEARQRAWVVTVARNLVVDRYRSAATRRATTGALALEAAVQPSTGTVEDQVVSRQQLAAVGEAIGRLPEQEREVLTMVTVGEMTSTQVGEALGIAPGTVRYRLHQARQHLAAALDMEAQG